MLSSLLRPRKGRRRIDKSPSSPFSTSPGATRNRNRNDDHDNEHDSDEEEEQDEYNGADMGYHEEDEEEEEDDEENTPLLPIFSAAILDKLPLYNITHSIRIVIVQKCETTLSWEQLRSPQVSQFLVKPIQSQIRTNHFNRATLCALVANCLQFQKEASSSPGNAGVSKTRAMVSELLAIRLLKEFSTRELIDALSYDFDPLQGLSPSGTGGTTTPGQGLSHGRTYGRGARISTVEIAIRAQAKRFLAHPLVVQQLEAIWAGTIVFHSAADNLHRKPQRNSAIYGRRYGTLEEVSPRALPADAAVSRKASAQTLSQPVTARRSVTLYDPREASLFKLSRLRVPRYRQLFSTLSFAVMLGLFLAVLVEKSLDITPLEIIFWIWSAGYMLDEVVGFSEQGFGLYIMSVWNAFDLGILMLFFAYYVLRLYGILMPDVRKHHVANMAYDVLASTAVLLFPRAFSVLDHYKYFSQLLIAFRMMAQDLVAVLILILISCSGFFVAFTLSFSDVKTDSNAIAYALFQILMGFTPAAWDRWPTYNILGKTIMAMFLIICHFLIVTILITVLTNSFMDIVRNGNEEHQFLFAVNTISMVKSDALFSYIPPTNLFGWLLAPLRYLIPFRQFVKFNRTIIKVTHFPLLFGIFAYERLFLFNMAYDPTELIERRAVSTMNFRPFAAGKAQEAYSPGHGTRRIREPSVVDATKDRALSEVFRRPFKGSTMRTTGADMEGERQNSTNVVADWMQEMDNEGVASPPMEQPRSVLERLETRRPLYRRSTTSNRLRTLRRDVSTATRSVLSEPDDSHAVGPVRPHRIEEEADMGDSTEILARDTDADGDDELPSHDEGEDVTVAPSSRPRDTPESELNKDALEVAGHESADDYFATPTVKTPAQFPASLSTAARARLLDAGPSGSVPASSSVRRPHDRHASTNTILFAPASGPKPNSASPSEIPPSRKGSRPTTAKNSGGTSTPSGLAPLTGRRTPKPQPGSKARPIMPARHVHPTAPNLATLPGFQFSSSARRMRQPSFNAIALDLASDIGDNRYGPDIDVGGISGMPASFSEQLLREREWTREFARRREEERRRSEEEQTGMVGRLIMARMNTLEESFREVLKEVKDLSRAGSALGGSRGTSDIGSGVGGGMKRGKSGLALEALSKLRSTDGSSGPKTPVGKTIGESRSRKSPRKLQRRNTKGKEAVAVGVESPGVSPRSAKSADKETEEGQGANNGTEDAGTSKATGQENQRPSRAEE